jgi:hypothetical protein
MTEQPDTGPEPDKRMKPDFLCIGAKKAGTTWIYDQLRQHPDIWLPPVKELNAFFDPQANPKDAERLAKRRAELARQRAEGALPAGDPDFWQAYLRGDAGQGGADSFAWYGSLFAEAGGKRAGDVDPNLYAFYIRQLIMLRERLPEMKLICILRHPLARSWSHLSMICRAQNINMAASSLAQLVEPLQRPAMATFSAYRQIIPILQRFFAPRRLLFLAFDDIVNDPAGLLRRTWDFLEVGAAEVPASVREKSNAGSSIAIPPEVRRAMADFHHADLDAALQVLGVGPDRLVL